MSINRADYELTLARYSDSNEAVDLLRQYRPYLEMIPSMRRPEESLITIPLPTAKLRKVPLGREADNFAPIVATSKTVMLPCDLVYLMCDPEWKVKMGGEIIAFIHRPEEELSDLLSRWRQTQVLLDCDYEWVVPNYYRHIISESADRLYPLFVLFPQTAEHIVRGLKGAHLPFIIYRDRDETAPELTAC